MVRADRRRLLLHPCCTVHHCPVVLSLPGKNDWQGSQCLGCKRFSLKQLLSAGNEIHVTNLQNYPSVCYSRMDYSPELFNLTSAFFFGKMHSHYFLFLHLLPTLPEQSQSVRYSFDTPHFTYCHSKAYSSTFVLS